MTPEQFSALEALRREPDGERLWAAMLAFEGERFRTASGLEFTYAFKPNRYGQRGNELSFSRKEKTVTRSTVEAALRRCLELGGGQLPVTLSGPKMLGTFGASYLYPVFIRLGIVQPGGVPPRRGRRKRKE